MLCTLPQGSYTSPGTQGRPKSLLAPRSPELVSVCPCTLHLRWVRGDPSSHSQISDAVSDVVMGEGALGEGDSPKRWIEGLKWLFCFSYE